jgi:hypothetical protein
MIYHIWITDDSRISIDDESPDTEGLCVTLHNGELYHGDDLEFEDDRLNVEAMDAAMAETLAQHDLSDPDQRAHVTTVFERTKKTAEEKIADHTSMLKLSEKYLQQIASANPKRRRHLR